MTERKVANVGIAGATRRFGSPVLENLLGSSDMKVKGLCCNASKPDSKNSQSSPIEAMEGDVLNQSTLARFVSSLDVVICAYLGDNDFMVNGQ
jgi:putative NADH-flavin reductase